MTEQLSAGSASAGLGPLGPDPLAWLLGVSDSTPFLEHDFRQRWFHAPSDDRRRFSDLLSLSDLDDVLGRFGVRFPQIKLVNAGGPVPSAEYLWRDNMVDPTRVAQLFSEGATVIFGGLHDRHEPARRLCEAVSGQISARTQTNIYVTPPNAQGFKPHWDTHDVFVLQIEGSKRWRMYGGGLELPLKDQKFDPERHAPGEVESELTLEAGEALYVPRGLMHAAATTDAVSIHITLGVMSYTWGDLLVDAVAELVERDARWRESLPVGFARGAVTPDALAGELRQRLSELGDAVDLASVVRERQRTFAGHLRPRASDFLTQVAGASELEPGDTVVWREGVLGEVHSEDGRLTLRSGTRELDLPAAASTVVERLLERAPVIANELDEALDWPSTRIVLMALIREGWVTRVR